MKTLLTSGAISKGCRSETWPSRRETRRRKTSGRTVRKQATSKGYVVAVETADKMTDRKITAYVRDYFAHQSPVITLR